ncbi:MAG: hypothetical protein WCL27_11225 [Betaproteobacteria bacterium]
METSFLLSDPVAAHAALMRLWPTIKGELMAGNRHVIEVHPYEEKLTDLESVFPVMRCQKEVIEDFFGIRRSLRNVDTIFYL